MASLRQIGAGILLALISILVVLGGFSLSRTQAGLANSTPVTVTRQFIVPTSFPAISFLTETPRAAATVNLTGTALPQTTETASPTPPPTSASCLPPAGWFAIIVQANDTLDSLAQLYQTSVAAIKQGNCLFSDQLVVGSYLYVPPKSTATLVPCGAPAGWVNYYVVAGDTLYKISLLYRVTVADLQRANCLGSSTYIQAGKAIKVPNVATSTPWVTATWTATVTVTPPPAYP